MAASSRDDVRKAQLAATAQHTAAADNVQTLYGRQLRRDAVDGMRRTIAQRLIQSKQTVPHFYLTVTCDLTSFWKPASA